MRRESAETIGLAALAYLAAAPEEFQTFMDLSGVDVVAVRAHAADPEFLAGVLDFVLGHESLLTAFCDNQGVEPRQVHLARRELAGPSEE